mgnify:CR=1
MNNGTYECPHCSKGFVERLTPEDGYIKNCPTQQKTKKRQFEQRMKNKVR